MSVGCIDSPIRSGMKLASWEIQRLFNYNHVDIDNNDNIYHMYYIYT